MAITAQPYKFLRDFLLTGDINFTTDPLHIMLLKNTYTPDYEVDDYVSTIYGQHEIDDSSNGSQGYPWGGLPLANVSVADATGVTTLNADPVTFISLANATFRYAVLIFAPPSSPPGPLLGCIDLGEDLTISDDFSLDFPDGVLVLAAS